MAVCRGHISHHIRMHKTNTNAFCRRGPRPSSVPLGDGESPFRTVSSLEQMLLWLKSTCTWRQRSTKDHDLKQWWLEEALGKEWNSHRESSQTSSSSSMQLSRVLVKWLSSQNVYLAVFVFAPSEIQQDSHVILVLLL